MKKYYRIPIMSIEDTLVNIENNPKYLKLEKFIDENEEGGEDTHIEIVLGIRWYPEVVTTDRWLAWKLVQKY